ncbi:MAG: MCP four helix bundle domain-containing protein [Bryobacterales bacterium]|nr:MCP four helix bundle domain-containing protein [Bryobacterales bacterium]MBV9397915.1 MCP four helix bundle domain-containing protein [Bryobacterales bacterium]
MGSSRLTLLAGFGGLLAIMCLAGVDALRVLQQFRRGDDQIRSRYLGQNHRLNEIRSDVYLSGTYVRDYLLEPDPERAEAYRKNLQDVRKQMDSALEAYGRQADRAELQHYMALQNELAKYWDVLAPIFHWDAAERRLSGYAFLRDEVFPRRQNMLSIADRIATINDQQLTAGNEQVVSLLLRFQTRLVLTLIVALMIGLALAAFIMRKILKLEDQARVRYEEATDARIQLKDLSARLVQAQETERRALSRELHDEVGQSLSAVLVELRNLSVAQPVRSEEQLRSHVETIKALIENTVRVVRNMSLLLRPSMLDDLGLIPALKWQARECSKRTGMDVSVVAEFDSDNLPDDYKTCLYRVVQEALHNCARHSKATTVRIKVQQENQHLVLTILDDGQGFDAHQTKGLGLLGIQERAARLNGACDIHSVPGAGTILSLDLPLPADHPKIEPLSIDDGTATASEIHTHSVG